ncbi:MAG TPA: lipase family protein [Bryobacteraceae bacterium]
MLKNFACLQPTPDNLYYPPAKGDYVYFEGPAFQSGPAFRFPNASWAADAAMLAYARYKRTRMTEADLNGILGPHFTTRETIGDCFVDNASTGRGFFAGNGKFAILAFRGTERYNEHDVQADGDVALVDEQAGGKPAGRVHRGFQRYLRSIWPRVKQLVAAYRADHPVQEICITGHSLGAAMAVLAFLELEDQHSSLYTFGCPRVGNQAFCESLGNLAKTRPVYYFIDNQDVVTHIPLPIWMAGYEHPNCAIFVIYPNGGIAQHSKHPSMPEVKLTDLRDFLKGIWKQGISLPAPLADHSPVRYCHWISKA